MEIFGLLFISLIMFSGSYIIGCLPIFFVFNERRIRFMSIFGAGMLVGTALSVIIPEGITTLYDSSFKDDNSVLSSINLKNEASNQNLKHSLVNDNYSIEEKHKSKNDKLKNLVKNNNTKKTHLKQNFTKPIGIALTLGFLLMFIIDQFSKSKATGRNKSVFTIGLVIHAAADGIAMGSALTLNGTELQIIVFFAIMIHKGPAAFALVSFLIMEGLEKFKVRKHLLIFSLAAPLASIITYMFLKNIETQSILLNNYVTGVILIFSAGTFLYIAATHMLPELLEAKSNLSLDTNNHLYFSFLESSLFVFSSLLPFLFSIHSH